mmetsp:Transcript_43984/g.92088  ORF Transcript_43984/g.92088 Transcript_43984/m.92088 type:complete len:312 (-) Transcript_43984:165-1100(-)
MEKCGFWNGRNHFYWQRWTENCYRYKDSEGCGISCGYLSQSTGQRCGSGTHFLRAMPGGKSNTLRRHQENRFQVAGGILVADEGGLRQALQDAVRRGGPPGQVRIRAPASHLRLCDDADHQVDRRRIRHGRAQLRRRHAHRRDRPDPPLPGLHHLQPHRQERGRLPHQGVRGVPRHRRRHVARAPHRQGDEPQPPGPRRGPHRRHEPLGPPRRRSGRRRRPRDRLHRPHPRQHGAGLRLGPRHARPRRPGRPHDGAVRRVRGRPDGGRGRCRAPGPVRPQGAPPGGGAPAQGGPRGGGQARRRPRPHPRAL